MRHLVGATSSPMTVPTQVASRCYIRLVAHTMQARSAPQGHRLVKQGDVECFPIRQVWLQLHWQDMVTGTLGDKPELGLPS
jgi:hypothetical protein